MAEYVTFWFGPRPWGPALQDENEEGLPRVRTKEIPAPIGELCLGCDEAIQEGDYGELVVLGGGTQAAPTAELRPLHRECGLLRGVGHEVGLCNCTNYEGLSLREAAIECDRRWRRRGAFGRYFLRN